MKVLNEWETVQRIIDERLSISRYGDGEFKICLGRAAKSQKADPILAQKLKVILVSKQENHLIGIPRIFTPRTDWPTPEKEKFWNRFTGSKIRCLLVHGKTYGSAFITRPDAAADINCSRYYDLVKSIWAGRRVLLVQGKISNFAKKPIFSTAQGLREIRAPATDAFRKYDKLFQQIMEKTDPETVIVLSLGPTATALAYDLCKNRRQALDLGHMGQYYAHIHPKSRPLSE